MANPDFGGFVTIIPLELQIFINILNFVRSIGRVFRREIRLLFERLENLKETSNNGEEWISRFPEEIENWKSHIRKSRI
ncbi:MAG: hypothetical protein ACE5K0_09090 [Candidatus Methanofastidiosia archaeon]